MGGGENTVRVRPERHNYRTLRELAERSGKEEGGEEGLRE